MYVKMFESKKIRITNYHMKRLLQRFDSSRFKHVEKPWQPESVVMQNSTPCWLCKSYFKGRRAAPNCGKCPLRMFEISDANSSYENYLGCSYILRRVAPGQHVRIGLGCVTYHYRNSSVALEELKVITDFLKSFKKE